MFINFLFTGYIYLTFNDIIDLFTYVFLRYSSIYLILVGDLKRRR